LTIRAKVIEIIVRLPPSQNPIYFLKRTSANTK